jgi:hypothetical protein
LTAAARTATLRTAPVPPKARRRPNPTRLETSVRVDAGDLAPLVLRPAEPADAGAVLACHNDVFASGAPGVAPRTLAHWTWKFVANPVGRVVQMLAVHPDAGVVGVYAGIPVPVSLGGRRFVAAQGVDFCVRGPWLKHGGVHGLFPRLGRAFLDHWLGTGDDRLLFTYGLPVAAFRSGALHLGWQVVRDWTATCRELPPGTPARAVPGQRVVRAVARFGADVDALFARLEPGFGVTTVRDSRYLNWRYADHPERRHTLFECRERCSDRLLGIAVYATGDLGRPHTGFVLDWLHDTADGDTLVALLAAVEAAAMADGTGMLVAVWSPSDPRFLAVQQQGWHVRGTPWFLVVASAAYDPVFFRERWQFTLGDSDLL